MLRSTGMALAHSVVHHKGNGTNKAISTKLSFDLAAERVESTLEKPFPESALRGCHGRWATALTPVDRDLSPIRDP